VGLARADAVVVMGEGDPGLAQLPGGPPRLRACLLPTSDPSAFKGARVVAFAGIGRPRKFFDTLERLGSTILARHAFADHQPYSSAMLAPILAEAERLGAQILTTEKDWVRIPEELRDRITPVPVTVSWDSAREVEALLDQLFTHRAARGEPATAR